MIFTSTVDTSYTKIFNAIASVKALTAIALSSGGVKTCAEDEIPFALALNDAEAGEDVSVQIRGGGLWKAGDAFNAGDFLSVGADGTAIAAEAGKFIFAQAMTSGTADGAAEVLILRAGYAKATS